ncbi:MAG: tRNA preQ1(34) S-adenosylmethionine ribosyltransferase-isomerase QueA [Firmicutes bacterium]|nr:tRNA preQ1(34) S-adenosylmethionine ribosyltransferase-isomerase QueA [Bacillota bacterium]
MRVDEFDYFLPEELIAQEAIEPRDHSRMLFMSRESGNLQHKHFYDLPDLLEPGDLLVLNDTKVIPARIFAHKETGAVIELLLLKQVALDVWQALVKPGKKAQPGTKLLFDLPEITAEVLDFSEDGSRLIKFTYQGIFYDILDRMGKMPLPPYIKKTLEDPNRYQPVYARERGSAAAPTAGLHFTPELLQRISEKNEIAKVMLHVGLGTFRPVKEENVEDHPMHKEFYRIDEFAASAINNAKKEGRRIIAVGTTTVRTLESAADENGFVKAGESWTQKYIYPGYKFKCVDAIITNFHLPKSTLIMMISAFAGKDNVFNAYEEAIKNEYRFYSLGDCMFIK